MYDNGDVCDRALLDANQTQTLRNSSFVWKINFVCSLGRGPGKWGGVNGNSRSIACVFVCVWLCTLCWQCLCIIIMYAYVSACVCFRPEIYIIKWVCQICQKCGLNKAYYREDEWSLKHQWLTGKCINLIDDG